jgi:parallel beta-helix repeat protein
MLTTYTVGVLTDANAVFGTPSNPIYTLRSAIAAANGNMNSGTADLINFQTGLSGTVTVNSLMTLTHSVQITGPGSTSVTYLKGSATTGIQVSISGSTAATTISGLNLVGFDTGIKVSTGPTSSVSVFGNTIDMGGTGIEVAASCAVTLSSNTIYSNSSYGEYVHDSSGGKVTLIGDYIHNNGRDGIKLYNANRQFSIKEEDILSNGSTAGAGILIDTCVYSGTGTFAPEIDPNGLIPNVIGGNNGPGIWLVNSSLPALTINQNFIGTDISGSALSNIGFGILEVDPIGWTANRVE